MDADALRGTGDGRDDRWRPTVGGVFRAIHNLVAMVFYVVAFMELGPHPADGRQFLIIALLFTVLGGQGASNPRRD